MKSDNQNKTLAETPSAAVAESPEQSRKRIRYVYAIAFTASVGGFLFGYDLSCIGAANIFLKQQFHLDPAALGFTTASAALGCMVGPVWGGWLCDAIGRERTMIVAAVLLAIGSIMTAMAQSVVVFNIFRILGGVGVGLCSVASPMYLAEIAPHKIRGKLGVMYLQALVIGSTVAPLVAYGLVRIFPDTVYWRWMFGVQMVVVILFAIFLFMLPQSPRWLVQKGRLDEAARVLDRIHGAGTAPAELREIKEAIAKESGGIRELSLPGIRHAVVIGLLLAFFNNWTGWSGMGGYIPMLFEMAGVKQHAAILQFSFTYLAMAFMTVVSSYFIDRVGRRPLWITASILMAVITGATGLIFHFQVHGVAVLFIIILCAAPHGLALAPVPWLMMSELFPNRIRAKAVAVTTTFLWLCVFLVAQLFPVFIDWSQRLIGSAAGAFWVFTLICVSSALFGWRMMPETKGRTLEEIGRSW